jgi:hypothetical protein
VKAAVRSTLILEKLTVEGNAAIWLEVVAADLSTQDTCSELDGADPRDSKIAFDTAVDTCTIDFDTCTTVSLQHAVRN